MGPGEKRLILEERVLDWIHCAGVEGKERVSPLRDCKQHCFGVLELRHTVPSDREAPMRLGRVVRDHCKLLRIFRTFFWVMQKYKAMYH